jgi:primosomal protein N' (replication factor Y)
MSAAVLRIALDMPLRRLFDYLPGESGGRATAEVGQRVRVPFGRQRLVGLVMEHADSSELPAERLKPVLDVLDTEPVLDQAALELLRWAADYYHHPIGEVIAAAIPKSLRTGASAVALEERWSATAEGAEALGRGEPKRAPKQRALLSYLVEHGGATAPALTAALNEWQPAARALAKRGWVASTEQPVEVDDPTGSDAEAITRCEALELSADQRNAVEDVGNALGKFGAFVL